MPGLRALLELLYPPACLACARVLPHAEASFCEGCDLGVERLPPEVCGRCGEPGAHAFGTCVRCERAPPPFTRAWAPLAHAGPVARAVHRFKYEDHPELAPGLGELLAREAVRYLGATPSTLVAVPLHAQRFRERRYDQAALLAGALARRLGRPHDAHALVRERPTARQVGLSEEARAQNVAGAFRADPARAAGRAFLLVDDVFTTGATARAAAAALRAAGATDVWVLTLARAFSA